MKFLFLSEAADSIGIALRMAEAEGHDVFFHIADDEVEHVGDGFAVQKIGSVESYTELFDKDTTIVSDCTGNGFLCGMLRSSGYNVVGGASIADRLENDRVFAMDTMTKCGIQVPGYEYFEDWDAARKWLEGPAARQPKLVFKPCKELSGCLPSQVATPEFLLEMLDGFAEHFKGKPAFVLQQFIDGVAVSSEAWRSNLGWLSPTNHTLETKHLMNGDLGPSGGCTGNVVWRCGSADRREACALCASLFSEELNDLLRSYRGPVDINAVLSRSDGEAYGLEFTPRFGYDATPTLFYVLLGGADPDKTSFGEPNIGKFLYEVAAGGIDYIPLRSGVALGIKITRPPWPSEKYKSDGNVPIEVPHRFKQSFCPYNVRLNEDNDLVTAEGYGLVGIAIGYEPPRGGEITPGVIERSFASALDVAKAIHVPDAQFRTDLGKTFTKQFSQLRSAIHLAGVAAA